MSMTKLIIMLKVPTVSRFIEIEQAQFFKAKPPPHWSEKNRGIFLYYYAYIWA